MVYSSTLLYNIQLISEQKLTIEQSIQIFRLKIMIDEIQMTKNKESRAEETAVSERKNKNHSKDSEETFAPQIMLVKLNSFLNSELEKAATAYILLWQTLVDDSPKIQKIFQLLQNCWNAFNSVESVWTKNKVFEGLNLIGKRNYGLFVGQILQREYRGNEILKSFYTKLKYSIKKKNDINNFRLDQDLGSISDPILIIKLDQVRHLHKNAVQPRK